jgi:D-alanyl-D-alanine carboxypeptidase
MFLHAWSRPIPVLLVACLTASACAKSSKPPEGPSLAREPLRAFLEAFNTGDRATLERFAKTGATEKYQNAKQIDEALQLQKQTGGFDLLELTDVERTAVTGWVRARDSDALMELVVEVEKAPPHRIEFFHIGWGQPPQKYFPSRMKEAEAIEALRAQLTSRTAADKFSGVVLVARGDAVLLREAHGLADRDAKTPNTIGSRFRLGSMNKMFTAVAILKLAQMGKLQLKDTVGKYLPGVTDKTLAGATLDQLLSHTGGAGDIFDVRFDQHRRELRTHADYVRLFGNDAARFPPGKQFGYSNFGYVMLGEVIEVVSGMSYYDFVRKEVFIPAGMSRTDSLPEDEAVEGRVAPYMRPPGTHAWIPAADTLPVRGTAAGGGYSTVDDLLRFVTALRANRLLDKEHTELMLTMKREQWKGSGYAYGIEIKDYPWTGLWLGHGGGAPGMNGDLRFSPETGYVIVALSNLDPSAATHVSDYIAVRLPLP